jgi:hypothetical protein
MNFTAKLSTVAALHTQCNQNMLRINHAHPDISHAVTF